MSDIQDPHEIDLAALFPSWPADRRAEVRDLLDGYCEVAYRVFERLEMDQRAELDVPKESS